MLYGDKASTQVASGTNLLTKAFTFGGGWSVVLKDGSIVTSEDLIRWGDRYASLYGGGQYGDSLPAGTVTNANQVSRLDPASIRFSQNSVNGSQQIIDSMKTNGWQGDPIDVVKMPDGKITTIDNTRVVAAREAGIEVEATVHSFDEPLPIDLIERFTTKNGVPKTWGEAVLLRIEKQSGGFSTENPYGSTEIINVK